MNALGNYVHPCGRCYALYYEYKQLVEHLYWAHGTESVQCKLCGLQKWQFAKHICHVLPIEDLDSSFGSTNSDSAHNESVGETINIKRESEYCYCGKVSGGPMIGCDNAQCALQWYHFPCVGITIPPDDEWYCPECRKLCEMFKRDNVQCIEVQTVNI